MKKLIKSMFLLTALSGSLFMASCGDDDTDTTKESAAPTVTLNNGVATAFVSLSIDSIVLDVTASADVDRKIKNITMTRAITSQATNTIFNKSYDAKDVITSHSDIIAGSIALNEADVITYTVSVKDDKDKVTTKTYVVTVASMATSAQILIGAPSNTTNEYRFYGIADNFRRYRAGSTGADLANANSAKIDFLYFYNSAGSVGNAFYSPDYAFGAGSGWNSETATWPTKNKTKLKVTDIQASAFDALNGAQFLTELNNIDFSAGTVDRIPNLQPNTVIAYQASTGKRGLIKIVNVAFSETGQITVVTKSEL